MSLPAVLGSAFLPQRATGASCQEQEPTGRLSTRKSQGSRGFRQRTDASANGWKREMGECYAAVRSNRLSTAHTATEHEAP